MSSTPSLIEERHEHVLRLTIDRPEAKNAIDEPLALDLEDALERAGRDQTLRVVLLSSTGDVFLSGGDLRALAQLPNDERGAEAVIGLGVRLAALERCALPVVACVHGSVYGGGCELLVMTDVVVMDEGAAIHFVHRKMGLVPAWGGATRLTERVGAARAADILLTARAVSAEEAARIGLASRLAPHGRARPEAIALAEDLAQAPREALVNMKRTLLAARSEGREDRMVRERKVFRVAWGSPQHLAAMERVLR
jgi:enoyl-CoA hydratase/carnithine racemase